MLKHAKQANPKVYTKTSLMLGLGETEEEVLQVRVFPLLFSLVCIFSSLGTSPTPRPPVGSTSLPLTHHHNPTRTDQAMRDMRANNVDVLTLGQYLRPTEHHLAVVEYVTPEKFDYYRVKGEVRVLGVCGGVCMCGGGFGGWMDGCGVVSLDNGSRVVI